MKKLSRTRSRKLAILVTLLCIMVVTVGAAYWWHAATSADEQAAEEPVKERIVFPLENSPGLRENSTIITPQEKLVNDGIVTIRFNICHEGYDRFTFGLGSTNFYFKGIEDGKCHFYMGTEIEDPRWDGVLGQECYVPVDYESSYKVGTSGADLGFVSRYCK